MQLDERFYDVDDFMIFFEQGLKEHQLGETTATHSGRGKTCTMYLSEVRTSIIYFHQSQYRDFKAYYIDHVQEQLTDEFANLVSYGRCTELMHQSLLPLCVYL